MPTMTVPEKIELLKKARAAAEAVKNEIERQNRSEIDPVVVARRDPTLQRAITLIEDAGEKIDDLEDSEITVEIGAPTLDRLTTLAAQLDAKIAGNAFLNLGIDSLTEVLNGASEIKTALA